MWMIFGYMGYRHPITMQIYYTIVSQLWPGRASVGCCFMRSVSLLLRPHKDCFSGILDLPSYTLERTRNKIDGGKI